MAATRRELLSGLGAGLALLQGGALAAGGEAVAAPRYATVREVDELRREVRDHIQRQQNALARVRRTGFGPAVYQFYDDFSDASTPKFISVNDVGSPSEFLTPFPGSIIALSIVVPSAYSGAAGSNYNVFEVYVDGAATGITATLAGGSTSAYVFADKGEATFAAGSLVSIYATKTGTPVPASMGHSIAVWVSNT